MLGAQLTTVTASTLSPAKRPETSLCTTGLRGLTDLLKVTQQIKARAGSGSFQGGQNSCHCSHAALSTVTEDGDRLRGGHHSGPEAQP